MQSPKTRDATILEDLLSGRATPSGPVSSFVLSELRSSHAELQVRERATQHAYEQYMQLSGSTTALGARVQYLGERLVQLEQATAPDLVSEEGS